MADFTIDVPNDGRWPLAKAKVAVLREFHAWSGSVGDSQWGPYTVEVSLPAVQLKLGYLAAPHIVDIARRQSGKGPE
ncbi:MAG: hypothetical protein Q8O76_13190, partial [Chloroflexota bacterium]|nr:hypothetical protein [Chloroflexota bacterium]